MEDLHMSKFKEEILKKLQTSSSAKKALMENGFTEKELQNIANLSEGDLQKRFTPKVLGLMGISPSSIAGSESTETKKDKDKYK